MLEREGEKMMETSWHATVRGTGWKGWFKSYVYFKLSSHINSVGFPLISMDKLLPWIGNPQWNTQKRGTPRMPAMDISSITVPLFVQFSLFIPWKSELVPSLSSHKSQGILNTWFHHMTQNGRSYFHLHIHIQPVEKEKRKREGMSLSLKDMTWNLPTSLLLTFHWPDLSHMIMLGYKGSWEMNTGKSCAQLKFLVQ